MSPSALDPPGCAADMTTVRGAVEPKAMLGANPVVVWPVFEHPPRHRGVAAAGQLEGGRAKVAPDVRNVTAVGSTT